MALCFSVRAATRRRAMSLPDLFWLLAFLLVLLVVAIPAITRARQQGKMAVCLSNMRFLAQASHAYCAEDVRELLIPMHPLSVRRAHAEGFVGPWAWRTALPFAFGGRTPATDLRIGENRVGVMRKHRLWGAPTRPLNTYVYGQLSSADFDNLPMFRCPSDRGYPALDTRAVNEDQLDAPSACAGLPCYDFLGNSYRINNLGPVWTDGAGNEVLRARLSTAAEGHPASMIENPSREVLYSEPRFAWWARGPQPAAAKDAPSHLVAGWHGKPRADNVAYCDGSARRSEVDRLAEFDAETLRLMNVSEEHHERFDVVLRRGRTWQVDIYPAPGSLIRGFDPTGNPLMPDSALSGKRGWPYDHHTKNYPPD